MPKFKKGQVLWFYNGFLGPPVQCVYSHLSVIREYGNYHQVYFDTEQEYTRAISESPESLYTSLEDASRVRLMKTGAKRWCIKCLRTDGLVHRRPWPGTVAVTGNEYGTSYFMIPDNDGVSEDWVSVDPDEHVFETEAEANAAYIKIEREWINQLYLAHKNALERLIQFKEDAKEFYR